MTRIALGRLSRDEAAEQARLILGRSPGSAAIAGLVERSDGIPFFIEELLSVASTDGGSLPETLRELVLGRYARLRPSTQAVVRLLAAGGVRVEHGVVERVHDGDPAAFEAAIREAIAAHVLRADAMRLAEHRLRMADRLEGEALPQRSRVESLLERLHATRLAVRLHLIRATTEPAQIVVR